MESVQWLLSSAVSHGHHVLAWWIEYYGHRWLWCMVSVVEIGDVIVSALWEATLNTCILDAAGGGELAGLFGRLNAANMCLQGCTDRYMVSSGGCAHAAATVGRMHVCGKVSARLLTALMSVVMNAHLLV